MSNLYYSNGQYNIKKEMSKKTRTHKRIKLSIIVACSIIIAYAFIRGFIFTEQYYWSNDLISAIEQNNEQAVKKLLHKKNMNVNQPAGVAFPMYLIPFDEFTRTTPIEEASWNHNYDIVRMLIDYGADEKLDEALALALNDYNKDDVEITKLLLANGASVDQKISETPLLLWIAEWYPEDYTISGDEDIEIVKCNIVEIYDIVLNYSVSDDRLKKVMQDSVESAETSGNDKLVEYLYEKMK